MAFHHTSRKTQDGRTEYDVVGGLIPDAELAHYSA